MTPRMRIAHRLKRLTDEVTMLRGKVDEQEIYSAAKDEAMRDFVNMRISQLNSAIRSTNGPRPGESPEQYRARLVAANKRPNVLADRPAAPFAAGPATEGSEVERRVGPRETGE